MSWEILWKFVLIVGVSLFAVMAIWVTIAGARDLRRLLTRIDESHHDGSSE